MTDVQRSRQHLATVASAAMLVLAGAVLALAQDGSGDGWRIPPSAATESSPLAVDDALVAKGRQIYRSKCQRCHGVGGKGDGPEADPDRPPQDLTDPARAGRNPDGVMFYKVWNGRRKPKMPAFSTDLSKDEVWTVISYVKTLRR